MSTVRNLEPSILWNHFADLNAIPRPSKKEEKVIAFMKHFGESLKLETIVDKAGNVIIKKPATAGLADRQTVVLQSHLDMVHQKNADTNFDFLTQGIDMFVDGDWVKAKGTTLGADNGIGVAAIMSLLSSNDIPHPPIEALFTIDEETGMTGAKELKGGLLSGQIMLNLDTEEDTDLTIGCAGGIDVTATGAYTAETNTHDAALRISVKGLTGGHSGTEIHLGRGNANKLMNRLLSKLAASCNTGIHSIDGGSLRNAIPRESVAVVTFSSSDSNQLNAILAEMRGVFKNEYSHTDPNLDVVAEKTEKPATVMSHQFRDNFLNAVYACPNGIYRMTPTIEGLVQTSNNVARILVKDGSYTIQCLTRSSVNSEKMDLAEAIRSTFRLCGAEVGFSGEYPGWEPKPDAAIIKIMSETYTELFGGHAHVNAIHAGLECGIIGANYPDMQMISFGPNIYGAHSPDERAQISSVLKFWKYLLEVLKRVPKK